MNINTALRHRLCPTRLHLAIIVTLATLPCGINAANEVPVFLNEIHYDNAGGDNNEGVEVAGPSGTILDGWQLLFYNGNGGNLYKQVELNGVLPDLGTGIGLLSFAIPGLQNGPDGIALADDRGQVLQFLSYEGIFDATEGAANGLTSELIPVAELSTTSALDSLQLFGDGRLYAEFSWRGPQPNSFGAINQGQSFSIPDSPLAPVPAPAALPLLLSGLTGIGLLSRRRRRDC